MQNKSIDQIMQKICWFFNEVMNVESLHWEDVLKLSCSEYALWVVFECIQVYSFGFMAENQNELLMRRAIEMKNVNRLEK